MVRFLLIQPLQLILSSLLSLLHNHRILHLQLRALLLVLLLDLADVLSVLVEQLLQLFLLLLRLLVDRLLKFFVLLNLIVDLVFVLLDDHADLVEVFLFLKLELVFKGVLVLLGFFNDLCMGFAIGLEDSLAVFIFLFLLSIMFLAQFLNFCLVILLRSLHFKL